MEKKETELEEKRRREEQAHELQVLQLLSQNSGYIAPHNMYTFNPPPQASLPSQRSPTQSPLYGDY